MADAPPPDPTALEPTAPPDSPSSDEPDFRSNAWLLLIILGVILLAWLMAVVWQRMPEPGRALLAAPEPKPAKPAVSTRQRRPSPVEVSRVIGTGAETILGAPAVLLRPAHTPYRLQRLFDVTRRAEGFGLAELFRVPDEWLDNQPLLALDGESSLGTVPLRELESPGPEDRIVLLETRDATYAYPAAYFLDFIGLRDQVGDQTVVVAWSALSQTAQCLVAQVDGRTINWGDSGLIYRGDSVLYDVDTGSLWDPFSGRALTGPMVGVSARILPTSVWPWDECRASHPSALVPNLQPGKNVPATRKKQAADLLTAYLATSEPPVDMTYFKQTDSALPTKAFVLGVRVGTEARAYPIEALSDAGVDTLTDSLGGRTYQVHVTSPRTAYTSGEGEPLDAVVRLWFAWKEVCPETSVYALPAGKPDAP
jgi:hypothetical protein